MDTRAVVRVIEYKLFHVDCGAAFRSLLAFEEALNKPTHLYHARLLSCMYICVVAHMLQTKHLARHQSLPFTNLPNVSCLGDGSCVYNNLDYC